MNNPTPLGLRVALAVSAGGVLVRYPLYRDEARNAEADNQKILPEDKAATPPATQAATRGRTSYWELLRSWEVFKFRIGRPLPCLPTLRPTRRTPSPLRSPGPRTRGFLI